ncbi:MAG: hypothetical protein HQK51_17230 [Oligoflexia bacterium]|nr:hypothetical protein [Oligoflexia bacterium]
MPQINEEFLNKLKKKKPELRPYDLSYNTNKSKAANTNSNVSQLPAGEPSRGKTPLDNPALVVSPLAESPRVNLSTDNLPLVNSTPENTHLDRQISQTHVSKEPSRGKTPPDNSTLAISPPNKLSPVKPPLVKTHVVDSSTAHSPLADSTLVKTSPDNSTLAISPPDKSSPDESYLAKTSLDHSLIINSGTYDSNFKMFSFLIDKLSQLNANEIRMLQIIKKRVINSNEREVFISRVEFEKEGLQSKFITTIIKKLTEEGLISVKEAKNKTNKTVKSYSILEFWK